MLDSKRVRALAAIFSSTVALTGFATCGSDVTPDGNNSIRARIPAQDEAPIGQPRLPARQAPVTIASGFTKVFVHATWQ